VTIGMPGVTKTSHFRTGVPVVSAEELEVLAGSASVGDPLRFSIGAYFTLKIVSGDSRRSERNCFLLVVTSERS
jgi:hypothetical protein